jgi:hypothetical protein
MGYRVYREWQATADLRSAIAVEQVKRRFRRACLVVVAAGSAGLAAQVFGILVILGVL